MFLRNMKDTLSKVQFNSFSTEIGVLDFFESLAIMPKVHSTLEITFSEIIVQLKPANIP